MRASSNGTDSAVFRLPTRRSNFRNVRVEVDLRVLRWSYVRPDQLPSVTLWVRYLSDRRLYWPSVLRADGKRRSRRRCPAARIR